MSLRSLSVADLRRELERRERGGQKLLTQRNRIAAQIAALDAELSVLGVDGAPRRGRPPGPTGKRRGRPPGSKNKTGPRKPGRPAGGSRPKNAMNLPDALAAAIKPGAVVSPAEAAQKVKAAGYKTVSKTFGISVAHMLASDKRFKRQGRGQYLRVGAAPAAAAPAKGKPAKATAKPRAQSGRQSGRQLGRRPGRKPGRKPASQATAKVAPAAAQPAAQ